MLTLFRPVHRRANKSEKVGVTVEQNKKMCIIEYSDMNADMSDALDAHGVLLYGAGNICNHYISVDFLCNKILKDILSIYHLASKKIPYMDPVTKETITPTFVNGIKMEMFIFDVFPLADKYVVMNVLREEEFAPVKNANFTSNGTPSVDSPHTAKDLISNLHRKWLQDAGAIIDATTNNSNICEISPLVSYDGNNLENYNGKVVVLPCYIDNYK